MADHPYALRIPKNLRSLLEVEAAKRQQSLASYIVGACWAQLERHSTPWSIDAVVAARKGVTEAVTIPLACRKCGGETFHGNMQCVACDPVEVAICGKTWWEDGEHWECLMDAGHKESKHGMREMVRRLEQ